MSTQSVIAVVTGLALAPLLQGVINRTKAVFAGRRGAPLAQPYHDLRKLLGRGVVYSRTTTWLFRAMPPVSLAAVVAALCLLPSPGAPALLAFPGDILLFVYLLAVARFFTVLAALDTGSSFEGMGASREVMVAAVAEPALLLSFAALARVAGSSSLSGLYPPLAGPAGQAAGPALVLVGAALLLVFLAENARIPVDDPNTHLELTMIHEVMILDYSGPDLALVLYGAALKLWVLGAIVVNLCLSAAGVTGWLGWPGFVAGMLALAVLVGVIESIMARLSMRKVPRLLIGAGALAVLAFVLAARFVA